MIPHPLVLRGQIIRLEPLEPEHIAPLLAISSANPELYRYTSTPVTPEQAEGYFKRAFDEREGGVAYPFIIRLQTTGEIIGSSRYSDIIWRNRNCELGYTWLHERYRGSAVNTESKLLMLRYAFEDMGLVRVQIHTDTRNSHSQEAIKRLGAAYEGTLRAHMIMKDGYLRDTMVFSIIHSDWPAVKEGLERRLEQKLTSSPH